MTTKINKETRKFLEDENNGPLTFGQMIEADRICEELTQKEYAEKLGISKSSLNDLEKGRVIPSIKRAISIAKKLKHPINTYVSIAIRDQLRRENLILENEIHIKLLKKNKVA